ncbi:hypothetical protein DM02DRAFT_372356 [Periconia macrospinosa]|uniref:Uncharacterized protein n=1 Tax=Periconia macrospinosa TaxID=97972 RepID=A0A2V1DS66_9PLEO|nr:hypothetical protein DM02DRAFT_372356 [Periconia macrospinosa]
MLQWSLSNLWDTVSSTITFNFFSRGYSQSLMETSQLFLELHSRRRYSLHHRQTTFNIPYLRVTVKTQRRWTYLTGFVREILPWTLPFRPSGLKPSSGLSSSVPVPTHAIDSEPHLCILLHYQAAISPHVCPRQRRSACDFVVIGIYNATTSFLSLLYTVV